jgi:hypothetical protein
MIHACVQRFDVMGGRGNILGLHAPAEPCVGHRGLRPPLPVKKMRMYAVGWDQSMDKSLKGSQA